MQRRIVIVHRRGSAPDKEWYPWLRKKLEKEGHTVISPVMPAKADIEAWIKSLHDAVGKLDSNTFFVGHSTGGQAVLRYLARQRGVSGGAVFVAGWLSLHDDIPNEDTQVWLATPLNVVAARRSMPKAIAIFSEDDKHVPLENKEFFERNLGAKTVVLDNKGHFTSDDKVKKVPEVLDAIEELVKE